MNFKNIKQRLDESSSFSTSANITPHVYFGGIIESHVECNRLLAEANSSFNVDERYSNELILEATMNGLSTDKIEVLTENVFTNILDSIVAFFKKAWAWIKGLGKKIKEWAKSKSAAIKQWWNKKKSEKDNKGGEPVKRKGYNWKFDNINDIAIKAADFRKGSADDIKDMIEKSFDKMKSTDGAVIMHGNESISISGFTVKIKAEIKSTFGSEEIEEYITKYTSEVKGEEVEFTVDDSWNKKADNFLTRADKELEAFAVIFADIDKSYAGVISRLDSMQKEAKDKRRKLEQEQRDGIKIALDDIRQGTVLAQSSISKLSAAHTKICNECMSDIMKYYNN